MLILYKKGFDMVIVSRYLAGAKSEDDDLIKGFGNWLFTKTINVLHGGHYTDAMVIFRAYKTKLIYNPELDQDGGYAMAEKYSEPRSVGNPCFRSERLSEN